MLVRSAPSAAAPAVPSLSNGTRASLVMTRASGEAHTVGGLASLAIGAGAQRDSTRGLGCPPHRPPPPPIGLRRARAGPVPEQKALAAPLSEGGVGGRVSGWRTVDGMQGDQAAALMARGQQADGVGRGVEGRAQVLPLFAHSCSCSPPPPPPRVQDLPCAGTSRRFCSQTWPVFAHGRGGYTLQCPNGGSRKFASDSATCAPTGGLTPSCASGCRCFRCCGY